MVRLNVLVAFMVWKQAVLGQQGKTLIQSQVYAPFEPKGPGAKGVD